MGGDVPFRIADTESARHTLCRPWPHRLARLCLRVKGLAAMVTDLESHGVQFISDSVSSGLAGGKQTLCFYDDPDGAVLELMEFF
jgi:hypothetical protein